MGILSKAHILIIAIAVSLVLLCGSFTGGYLVGHKRGSSSGSESVDAGIDAIQGQLAGSSDIIDVQVGTISDLDGEIQLSVDTVSEGIHIVRNIEESEQRTQEILGDNIERIDRVIDGISKYLAEP